MTTVIIPNIDQPEQKKRRRSKKFDNLVGPTDAKIDAQARELLTRARIQLYLKQPFFGNLATRLKMVNADQWCSTAATDGRRFYYNSRFVTKLRRREVEFLFGHEVLHVVYDHMGRRGDRDPQLYNIAADYCVNADLKKHDVGEFITSVPCLYDSKYLGWSSEQVYDDLYDKAEKIDISDLLDQMLDDHMDSDDEDDNQGQSGAAGKKTGSGDTEGVSTQRPRLSDSEREQIKQEVKQAVISAAQACEAGQVPGNVARMIKDLTEPKMPWRELLSSDLTSTIRTDYSFSRPNRRGWHMDAIMPGMTPGEEVDIAVFIDTSGSIGEQQVRDFLGEVKGIMESFASYRIHVVSFDTQCYNPQVFDSDNLDDISTYEPQGGGGTDFDAVFNYLKDNDIVPRRLVVFTDGYPFGSWGDDNYCDTTWIIHGDKNPNPPFGTWALYD